MRCSIYWPKQHIMLDFDDSCGGILLTLADGKKYMYLAQTAHPLVEFLHRYFMWQAIVEEPENFKIGVDELLMDKYGGYTMFGLNVVAIENMQNRYSCLKQGTFFDHIIEVSFEFEWYDMEMRHNMSEKLKFVHVF